MESVKRLVPRHSREGGTLVASYIEIPAFAGMTAKRMTAEGLA